MVDNTNVTSDNYIKFTIVLYIINMHKILVGFSINFLKGSQDIIKEISALDSFYQIS